MGSTKKFIYKLAGGKVVHRDSVEAKIDRGEGRMVDGAYQAYSAEDKAHFNSANANANAEYTDIAASSGLGRFFGSPDSLLGSVKKRKQQTRSTLLGGGGNSSVLGG